MDSEQPEYPDINLKKRLLDGTIPGAAVAAANPALRDNITTTYSNTTAVAAAGQAYDDWHHLDQAALKEIVTNVFRAYKEAVDNSVLDFSESGYLR
jgi:phage gpG-like protein